MIDVTGAEVPLLARRLLLALALAAALAGPSRAAAWGARGHEVVARMAELRLSPQALAAVRRITRGASLASREVALWADEHRTPATAPWHYVNIPFGARAYEPARDCRGGQCCVAALERMRERLRRATDPEEQLEALRWVVHLVGDLHQPLHAGDGFDRGGNGQRVRVGARREPTSLHHLWDDEVVDAAMRAEATHRDVERMAERLLRAGPVAGAAPFDPEGWAFSSHLEAQAIYEELGITPRSREIVSVSRDYAARHAAKAEALLRLAGLRLAAVLEGALGTGRARDEAR